MSNNNVYAGRKRRKPVPKSAKPSPAEGAKSNPSKRHRDRLNGELDQLASLLPFHQDIISKLDKLTVLRLSVGYLRAKGHFNVALNSNKSSQLANSISKSQVPEIPEGELLLQVINGFVLVVTEGGTVFYASSSVQDHLGFHQSDIVHQSVYDFIHTEDRAEFQRQLHWALNPSISTDTRQMERDSQLQLTYYSPEQLPPENSAFLERNFICRLRCLLDNSSGFLAMNFQGRLKFLQGQNKRTKEGTLIPPQLALFALASPLQPPSILEIRAKNYIYRTKHKLDFTPLACDAKGKIVLGYTEEELCYRGSGYQFIHAADMLYCADNHIRMMKTGESGMTVFRLLTKCSGWVWVQANARLVYKNGRPDFIIASQRVLTEEEGEENLKKRSLMLPFSFTTGEAVLYDSSLPKSLSGFSDPNAQENRNIPSPSTKLDPNSLLGSMLKQDKSIYKCSAGSNEPQAGFQEPEEEELGGIFSSNFQEGLLSLSESSLFKHDTVLNSRNEESGCELLSFMGSLGISPEDLELLDQEEIFLNVEFDDRAGLEDLTDEVLSYVEESLRKKTDLLYSSSFGACLEEKNLLNSAPSLLSSQCRPQEMSGPSFTSHQYLPFLDHPEPKIQPFAEVHSYIQPQPSMPTQGCQPQGFIYKTEELSQQQNLPYPVNYSCVEEPNQLCHRFKNIQGANCSFISPLESGHRAQNLPIFQQPGTFFLETSPLNLPYRNQLPNNCTQDFPISYLTSGDTRVNEFSSQDLEELLNGLEGGSQPKRGPPEGVQREDGCPWKPAGEL